jgi:hypothetical protein
MRTLYGTFDKADFQKDEIQMTTRIAAATLLFLVTRMATAQDYVACPVVDLWDNGGGNFTWLCDYWRVEGPDCVDLEGSVRTEPRVLTALADQIASMQSA